VRVHFHQLAVRRELQHVCAQKTPADACLDRQYSIRCQPTPACTCRRPKDHIARPVAAPSQLRVPGYIGHNHLRGVGFRLQLPRFVREAHNSGCGAHINRLRTRAGGIKRDPKGWSRPVANSLTVIALPSAVTPRSTNKTQPANPSQTGRRSARVNDARHHERPDAGPWVSLLFSERCMGVAASPPA